MKYLVSTSLMMLFIALNAHAAILVDETASDNLSADKAPAIFSSKPEVSHASSSTARAKDVYDDMASFKRKKKMGISTTIAGATGLFGMNLDLNIFEDFAVSLGGGLSHGFNSFNLHVKQTLGGDTIQPYFVLGYSRWYSNGGGPVDHTTPSIVSSKFLTASEKASGRFSENIIYPAIGLQYVNLSGDFQGVGVFAEFLMLMDLNSLAVGPTAGLGSVYYF